MKKKLVIMMALASQTGLLYAQSDNTETQQLEEVVVSGQSIKEDEPIRLRATSATQINAKDIEDKQIDALKATSSQIPNVHIPDYGSKTTSAIYIRGIGSRMDQPSVGLYVDGIPYFNKSAYDFDYSGIQSIQIMRGPQGTLYGRNAMAGIIDIQTRMPNDSTHRTDASVSYGNYNTINLQAAHYNHIGSVGIAASGYFKQNDGYFTNTYDDSKIGDVTSAGARLSATYKKNKFSLLYTANYDYSEQTGYPYALIDENGSSKICYDRKSGYDRQFFSNGLKLQFDLPHTILSSSTSYQYLDDNMRMDNDLTEKRYFQIQQRQFEHDLNEEIVLKKRIFGNEVPFYNYIFGASAFRQHLKLNAPVIMENEGISNFIESTVNNVEMLKQMGMTLDITNEDLPIVSKFDCPNYGAALFHQSTFNFSKKWTGQIGLRLDYEKDKIDYNSGMDATYSFASMVNGANVKTKLDGNEEQDYMQVLPKATLKYKIDNKNVIYASIAKGYKSGGYNTQMFADILQFQSQKDIKADLYNHVPERLTGVREMLAPILLDERTVNVKDIISYKPEYSWNYELGSHLSPSDKLDIDASLFFINCKDQQITVFSELNGMGRMMRNAGKTHSYGAEISAKYKATSNLSFEGNYGYTHATFKKNHPNDTTSYDGNFVPFVPQHTFMIGGAYAWMIRKNIIDMLTLRVNYNGTGKINWTEDNSVCQDYYGILNASLTAQKNDIRISVWGKNLTDSDYDTFYIETLGNKFVQKGKPLQFGATVKVTF